MFLAGVVWFLSFVKPFPREPDKSESGTNPGRQKRGRKSNLMMWVQMVQKLVLMHFQESKTVVVESKTVIKTVNFRAKTILFPTYWYQDLADRCCYSFIMSHHLRAAVQTRRQSVRRQRSTSELNKNIAL